MSPNVISPVGHNTSHTHSLHQPTYTPTAFAQSIPPDAGYFKGPQTPTSPLSCVTHSHVNCHCHSRSRSRSHSHGFRRIIRVTNTQREGFLALSHSTSLGIESAQSTSKLPPPPLPGPEERERVGSMERERTDAVKES